MPGRYIVSQINVTPTAGNDVLTVISAASRRLVLCEVSVAGRGTSSAAQALHVGHSPTGTTPGGAVTPNKFDHQDQPAAISTVATTWGTQPAPDANPEIMGFNALGGVNRWTPPRGRAIEVRNGDVISIRAAAGITWQAMSVSVVWEEDPQY